MDNNLIFNKRKRWLQNCIIFLSSVTFAFASDITSVHKELKANPSDSVKIRLFLELAEHYISLNEIDSAVIFLDSAKTTTGDNTWLPIFTEKFLNVNSALFTRSIFDVTLENSTYVIENYKRHQSDEAIVRSYDVQGSSAVYIGDFEFAQKSFDAFDLFIEELDESKFDKDKMVDIRLRHHFGMGIFEAVQGEYEKSLSWFLIADSLLQHGGSIDNKVFCKFYMGNVYAELAQSENAITMFKRVEEDYLKGAKINMIPVYHNLGLNLVLVEKFQEADTYFAKSLVLAREIGDSFSVAYNFLNQGVNLKAQKKPEMALERFYKSIELFALLKNELMVIEAKSILVEMVNDFEITTPEHLRMIGEVVDYFSTTEAKENYHAAILLQAKANYNLGNYKKAAEIYQLHDSLTASWLTNNFSQKTAELETKYRTNLYKEEAETQLQRAQVLELQNKRKNIILSFFIGFLVVMIVVSIIVYKLFSKIQISKREIASQNLKLAKREEEKSVLLRELHHRVKNNLQIVSSLLYLQSASAKDVSAQNAFKDGQNRVDAMALIHKYLYTSSELTQVDVNSYLSRLVESIAYSYNYDKSNLKMNFDFFPDPIDVDIAIPLGLIANELVSNAFKHAFKNSDHPELSVSLKTDHGIILRICDNGLGVPENVNKENSFGMELIDSLCKQLNGTLEYSFSEGACFELSIPESTLQHQVNT